MSSPLPFLAAPIRMLVQQCQLGFGYPVAISEAHEQAVITGHDREEFRRLTLMLLEQRGLPTPESAKATSKRRPWSEPIVPSGPSPARWSGFGPGGQSHRQPRCRRQLPSNARKITHKKSQAPTVHRRLAGVQHRLGHSLAGTPNAGWRPGRQLCLFSGAALIAGNESGRGSVTHRADHVTLPSMVQRDQRNHFPPPVLTGLAPLGSQRVRCPSHPSVHNTYYMIWQ